MHCRTLVSLCSKTTLRATAEKKPLSSTSNGDLCVYIFKALLLKFLIFRNGSMGMENLQLGQNTKAIHLAARAVARSSRRAPFSPLLPPCPAQVSAQPSTGTGMGTVSANMTPVRPWKLHINTRWFSSCPVIFSCAGKHAHIHKSVFTERTCSVTQNKKSASHVAELRFPEMPGNGG